MSTVLLQEDALRTEARSDNSTIPVPVTVNVVDGKTPFVEGKTNDYVITEEGVSLIGSGGVPREFLLTFTLSPEAQSKGYRFQNPALKFFQGGSKKAGFRVPPNTARTAATLSVFNTLDINDHCVQDGFNVLVANSEERIIHDPTILWEPPKG